MGNIIEDGEKAINFCETLGFSQFFETLPQGYLTIVGEEGINLSGGQKQLVGLARALYCQPSLLLIDEATSSMDNQTEAFIMNLLETLKPRMGILMITHQQSMAEKADNIYQLKNGRTLLLNSSLYYS